MVGCQLWPDGERGMEVLPFSDHILLLWVARTGLLLPSVPSHTKEWGNITVFLALAGKRCALSRYIMTPLYSFCVRVACSSHEAVFCVKVVLWWANWHELGQSPRPGMLLACWPL